ncbi:MAG: UDP-N-acetylmuramoyl-L-alanyl-D-glutamate--2,6-diaminopimelate ligase [Treponema sp.]|jgi:UDP-N-acetylmuramoyl-L-alanyl-D-glutamate--2,6-diaminopimelate ligase|nr:UDP-N-acetylmuramoyl-L-alanyl-D-glutamate--2,6-diaminopimelate ligase [Treponema sp.]
MEKTLNAFFDAGTAGEAGLITMINAGLNPLITGLEYDSRRIKPGNLYFALPGLHADGRSFVPDAVRQGAAAVLYQGELAAYRPDIVYIKVKDSRFAMSPAAAAFYGFPSRRLGVIGVTGTEGKSTTVYLIWQLLKLAGKRAGFISTVQFSPGGGAQWNPEHQTTPEAPAVHRLLAEMVSAGTEYAVLEASSHGLSPRTNRLGDVAFDAAVMTNVTHEHLEFHGTWEQYRNDKANLFRSLNRFSHDKFKDAAVPSFGVINAGDKSAAYFSAAAKRRCYTYSAAEDAGADLCLLSIESGAGGNRCEVRIGATGKQVSIRDQLPGAFNAGNVLAALLTVSALLGKPVEELIPLVPSLKPVRGRMTAVSRGQPFEVLVDYAHTPSSFETIFPPLRRRISGGRIISLFGSAGERDTGKRLQQGRIAAEWSDCIILTDEDPRGEEPMAVLKEIAAGIETGKRRWREGENLFLIPDRTAAVRRALSLARPGDLVLLLGKGHENSIIYSKETRPYDEIGEAEKALAELGF